MTELSIKILQHIDMFQDNHDSIQSVIRSHGVDLHVDI